jgi:hypothetical protein
MMRTVVAAACLVSAAVIAAYTHYSGGNTPEPVYTVPARALDPVPAPAVAPRPIDPTDRAVLARALQRELKRVGCYHGEITGVWTTSSRMAMKTFNERVNATLPVDNADPVLLSLVQGHRERACGTECRAGQTPAEGAACVPDAVAAKVAKTPPEAEKSTDVSAAAGAAAAGTAAAAALAAFGKTDAGQTEPGKTDPGRTVPKEAAPLSKASAPGAARPATGVDGPAPSEGMVRDGRPRRSAQTAPRPPKVVRDVLKALGF